MIHQTAALLILLPIAASLQCAFKLDTVQFGGIKFPYDLGTKTCPAGLDHCAHTSSMSIGDFNKLDAVKQDPWLSVSLMLAQSVSAYTCASTSDCKTINAAWKTDCSKDTGNCCTNSAVSSSFVFAALIAALARFALSN